MHQKAPTHANEPSYDNNAEMSPPDSTDSSYYADCGQTSDEDSSHSSNTSNFLTSRSDPSSESSGGSRGEFSGSIGYGSMETTSGSNMEKNRSYSEEGSSGNINVPTQDTQSLRRTHRSRRSRTRRHRWRRRELRNFLNLFQLRLENEKLRRLSQMVLYRNNELMNTLRNSLENMADKQTANQILAATENIDDPVPKLPCRLQQKCQGNKS